jgi:hypothetical protein
MKKPRIKLKLRRETLRALASQDLVRAVGGDPAALAVLALLAGSSKKEPSPSPSPEGSKVLPRIAECQRPRSSPPCSIREAGGLFGGDSAN